MILDFAMRISDCKRRIKREYGLRSDFGNRANINNKNSSDQFPSHFSIDLKSALRNLKSAIVTSAMVLALCSSVEGQQPKKFFRIGMLFIGGRNQPHLEAFKQGLRERGYTEGKDITFEYRYAEGKEDRLPGLAAELVHLKADVIVVTSDVGAQAVQQATKTLPIVVTTGDPVASGLADSLAKPGGNVTGLSVLLADLSGKRVEILKETFPKLTRVAALWNPTGRVASPVFKETSAAAQALSLQLHSFEVQTLPDIEKALVEIPKLRSSALLVLLTPLVTLHSKRIVELALKQHLPGMYPTRQFAEEGGLMAYGPLIGDLYRRAATYVDKILKGAKPADLPVEQPMRFEFIINLKAAKQIGVTIPPNVLARADKVRMNRFRFSILHWIGFGFFMCRFGIGRKEKELWLWMKHFVVCSF
jgi:putative ABC transport system substrate-binding protein